MFANRTVPERDAPKDMNQAEGDHIIAKENGGNGATVDDLSNLEVKCADCNNRKSDR
jgi:5-methylcytosine-specific restriction endonuclease McrA